MTNKLCVVGGIRGFTPLWTAKQDTSARSVATSDDSSPLSGRGVIFVTHYPDQVRVAGGATVCNGIGVVSGGNWVS